MGGRGSDKILRAGLNPWIGGSTGILFPLKGRTFRTFVYVFIL